MCDVRISDLPVCEYDHKIRHPSRKTAIQAMRVQLRFLLQLKARQRPTLQVYVCKGCGGYHIGNGDPEKMRQKRCGRPRVEPQVTDFEGE